MNSFFSGIKQDFQKNVLGEFGSVSFKFPTFFYESSCAVVALMCPLKKLELLVAKKGFKPLTIYGKSGLLVFSFYNHKRIEEMSPYSEVVISIPVMPKGRWYPPAIPLLNEKFFSHLRHFVVDMPVDSRINCLRGTELWNLPKTMAQITISDDDCESQLLVDRKDFELKIKLSKPAKRFSLHNETRVIGALGNKSIFFNNRISGDFTRANALFPFGEKPVGSIAWKAGDNHPLSVIDQTQLRLFETRYCSELKSILYLPNEFA